MRISDWSSDVCSSDLAAVAVLDRIAQQVADGGLHDGQRCQQFAGRQRLQVQLQVLARAQVEVVVDDLRKQLVEAEVVADLRQALRILGQHQQQRQQLLHPDRKSTRLDSSH